jgi:hypothetical protein
MLGQSQASVPQTLDLDHLMNQVVQHNTLLINKKEKKGGGKLAFK